MARLIRNLSLYYHLGKKKKLEKNLTDSVTFGNSWFLKNVRPNTKSDLKGYHVLQIYDLGIKKNACINF